MDFTDVRAEVNVTAGGIRIYNSTLSDNAPELWETGDHDFFYDNYTREVRMAFTGLNNKKNNVIMTGARCAGGPCIVPLPPIPVDPYDFTNRTRRWSDRFSWSSGD